MCRTYWRPCRVCASQIEPQSLGQEHSRHSTLSWSFLGTEQRTVAGLCRGKQPSPAVLHAAFELLGAMVASHAELMACQPLEGPCSTPFASHMHLHGGPLQTGAAMPPDRSGLVAPLWRAVLCSALRVSHRGLPFVDPS